MSEVVPTALIAAALKIVDWLHDGGYRASVIEESRSRVRSGASGFRFLVSAHEHSIQFYMGMTLSKGEEKAFDCNYQNQHWRFVKVYISDDNALCADLDVIINMAAVDAKETFDQAMDIWESGLARIKQWTATQLTPD